MWTAVVIQVAPVQARDERVCWRITTDRTDDPDRDCFFLFREDEPPKEGETVYVGTHHVWWGAPAHQVRKHLNDFWSMSSLSQ